MDVVTLTHLAASSGAAAGAGSVSAFLTILMPLLLGGGLITALVTLYRARRHVPVERDSIIVTGAQGAVLALEKSLQAETARADRAEKEAERLRSEKEHLLEQIDTLKKTLDDVQEQLEEVRRRVVETLPDNL